MPKKNKLSSHLSGPARFKESLGTVAQKFILMKALILEHPAVVFIQNISIPRRFFSKRNPVVNYIDKLLHTAIEAAFLVFTVGVLSFLIYYILAMFWDLYLITPMGTKFLAGHPQRAETILRLAELDLVYFCIELTLSCFVICLSISAICRVTHIASMLFLSQGLFGKLCYWGPALTGAGTYYIMNKYGFSSWEVTAVMVVIPTYLMFISCFKYSERLLPKTGDVIKALIPMILQSYQFLYIKINALIRNINQ